MKTSVNDLNYPSLNIHRMNRMIKNYNRLLSMVLVMFLAAGLFSSCVPLSKYKKANGDLAQCTEQKNKLDKDYKKLKDQYDEMDQVMKKLVQQLKQVTADTTSMGNQLRYTLGELKDLRAQYDALEFSTKQSARGTEKEIRKLLEDVQKNKELQLQKEDELKQLSKQLNEKEKSLNDLNKQLKEKEKRVNELEKVLAAKDSVVIALRKSVSDALKGYVGNGLTINMKNGKIYVSLDESLLFATASWEVGPQGTEALKKLGKVLVDNPDINIMVEGHTDNVPYKGSGQVKDNWDLSVMRATAVARIILASGDIKPSRVITAGRSEYVPVDGANTKEARAKNRRTEIILTPKLDELFKIIESN